jgi:hypothetical protein
MMDVETESLWSHLLGEAMAGPLRGERLEAIPADMATWKAWRRSHPKTTVLDLPPTTRMYTRAFYGSGGSREKFVVGFQGQHAMHHCEFGTLRRTPVVNVDADGLPLVIAFEPESTSLRLYLRRAGDRVLTLEAAGLERLRDRETGSMWDRSSGLAVAGTLRGEQLQPHVGIVSFRRAWLAFHPDSQEVGTASP